jgi:hypothetical protein
VTGEVQAFLAGRVVRLSPSRRVATVTVKGVGGRRPYSGGYSGASGQLAPVTGLGTSLPIGRVVRVDPTEGGCELDLIVGDDSAWHALAAGTAKVDALFAFESSSSGDPIGGRPVRVEVG